MPKLNDLTGRTFGLLTVVSHAGVETSRGGVKFQMWKCKCDCGGERVSRSNNLIPYDRLKYRLSHGWPVEAALFQSCAA